MATLVKKGVKYYSRIQVRVGEHKLQKRKSVYVKLLTDKYSFAKKRNIIVNFMNDLVNPKDSNWLSVKNQENSQFSVRGLYVKEDDQDWGSAGMNDIQKDPE